METIKSGRIIYNLIDGDTVMDNGACLQLVTRETGHGFNKTSPLVSKKEFKKFKENKNVISQKSENLHVTLWVYKKT